MLSRGVHKVLTGSFASSSRNNTLPSKTQKASAVSTTTTTTATNHNTADAAQHTAVQVPQNTADTDNSPRPHSKGKQQQQPEAELKTEAITTTEDEIRVEEDGDGKSTPIQSTMTNDRFHNVAAYDASMPPRIDTSGLLRPDTGRATPADPSSDRNWAGLANKKKKSTAFYNEAFAIREAGPQIPDSVGVMVEFRTNVILDNEFEFIKSLSQFIAKRYSRNEECVALTVDHSACMIMGGTFDGCYFVTITSPTLVSPTCNKRNVALLSEWVNNALGVPASRGYIRFVETDIANYAVGGITGLDVMERERAVSRAGLTSSYSKENTKPWKSAISRKQVPTYANGFHDPNRPQSDSYTESTLSGRTTAQSHYSLDKTPVAKRGRSMFGLFGRSQKIPA